MIVAPYLALAVTGTLVSYRTAGVLRIWIAFEALGTVLLKVLWEFHLINYGYWWRALEPVSCILAAAVALSLAKPRGTPLYAVYSATVHVLAAGYQARWPHSWLEAEIHASAFVHLLLGLYLIQSGVKDRLTAAVTALFLISAAGFYAAPYHPDVRIAVIWAESACFLWLAGITARAT